MKKIYLRPAAMNDAMFLFELANDSECRNNSLNSDKISFENHMEWFKEILEAPEKRQYILMDENQPVGQGRLELTEKGCRISYSIIPHRRGCGYGEILLKLLNNAILDEFPSCTYSYGEVLPHNVASRKIFENLGYYSKSLENYYHYKKEITYYDENLDNLQKTVEGIVTK